MSASAIAAALAASPAVYHWDAGKAPTKADTPMRVRPCDVDLWDREVFRNRVREIARKAKSIRNISSPKFGGDDDHLLPEIRDLKRRSFEILEARTLSNMNVYKVISNPDSIHVQSRADLLEQANQNMSRDHDLSETERIFFLKAKVDSSNKGEDLVVELNKSLEINRGDQDLYSRKEFAGADPRIIMIEENSVARNLQWQGRKVYQNLPIWLRFGHGRASWRIWCLPLLCHDMEGDRGPYGIKWPPPVLRKHKTLQPTNLRTHLAMDPGKKREIVEGKKHVVEEELSSAAKNGTPQNKLMRDAMKGGNHERPLQMYKTRITAAALSEALKEAAMGDGDAIAIDFDEIWQLRGGMVEKELDGHKFLIKFEQKGDFNHVLKGGPWLYQDYPMLVTEYDGKSSLADFPVNSMAVWVRVMDIPPGMMTENWARKMGDQLGTYKEIAKESKNQVWDKFYHVRIVVDVNHPILRWVKFQDQKTKEMIRYDVKYERMPIFCYFCGIVGHSDKHCLLPEEEKRVRYWLGQKASPYKPFEHRSFYLPTEPVKVKRHLQFQSKSIVDWQIGDVSGTDGVSQERVEIDAAPKDTEEDRTETANPEDVLQMVAAVENVKMQEGKGIINNQIVTDEQVSNAADSSLLEELRADAARMASSFLKQKSKILGKRPGCNDMLMQDAEQNLGRLLG
ncbi:hypothetical protein ACQ4PT_071299 [Festuca glaucescens]